MINVNTVLKLIKGIDGGKATGLYKIPSKPSALCIFNQSQHLTGIYPSDQKLAKVSPIFKNGSKSDLNNYRPVSTIPAEAKMF